MTRFIILAIACLPALAFADSSIEPKLNAALAASTRPAEDVARDANRLPLQTLEFFGLRDDMRVLELFPGGGWYTRVLAPVLADNGKLYVALGTGTISKNVLPDPGFDKVEVLATKDNLRRPPGSNNYVLDDVDFGVSDLDMVVTFRNLHNFNAENRAKVNAAVLAALKSGGLYGVVDHTRRHMEPSNPENRRRVDPVMVIKELLDQGFEFVDFSDLHFRADDELEYEVGRHTVTGNTDRFTFLFRKP
ncbi:MAG TPA: hypothetical protein PKK10_06855 [Woeseiaceae bacterium]|nr:hypothetical protein [Woeseiaceae bacterium]